jgi:hypothetical protein
VLQVFFGVQLGGFSDAGLTFSFSPAESAISAAPCRGSRFNQRLSRQVRPPEMIPIAEFRAIPGVLGVDETCSGANTSANVGRRKTGGSSGPLHISVAADSSHRSGCVQFVLFRNPDFCFSPGGPRDS